MAKWMKQWTSYFLVIETKADSPSVQIKTDLNDIASAPPSSGHLAQISKTSLFPVRVPRPVICAVGAHLVTVQRLGT